MDNARFVLMVLFFGLLTYQHNGVLDIMNLTFKLQGEQHLGVSKVCAAGWGDEAK